MKFRSTLNQKGFTLIELLVVIAIISLLSSVVLASLKDARDKAKKSAFRSEMNQLITALELYKADNGIYPNEGQDGYFIKRMDNSSSLSTFDLPLALNKYIPNVPIVRDPTSSNSLNAYVYYSNNASSPNQYKCGGSTEPTTLPPYVLVTYSNSKIALDSTGDWGIFWYSSNSGATFSQYSVLFRRCYSPK